MALFEKRAVVVSGEVARLWPLKYQTALAPGDSGYFAITEGSIFSHLRVQLFYSIGGAVGQAQKLSARMGGSPVIVARLLSSTDWY